jgi:hypothetical protein
MTELDVSFQPSLRDSVFFQLVTALKCRAIFNCSVGTTQLFEIFLATAKLSGNRTAQNPN